MNRMLTAYRDVGIVIGVVLALLVWAAFAWYGLYRAVVGCP